MKFSIFDAKLPFTQTVKGQSSNSFQFARFQVDSNSAVDFSCFPGFSDFDLEQTCFEFKQALEDSSFRPTSLSSLSNIKHPNPHVEFGLFQFLLNQLQLEERETPRISRLIKKSDELVAIANEGHHTSIKIKINANFNDFSNMIVQLKAALKLSAKLSYRLDANQRLTPELLNKYYKLLEENDLTAQLDYFEEPLAGYAQYKKLEAQIPIAIEESLDHFLADQSDFSPKAIVYKPSQQGLSRLSQIKKQKIVISSCFDPSSAFRATSFIAQDFPENQHGLSARTSDQDINFIRDLNLD